VFDVVPREPSQTPSEHANERLITVDLGDPVKEIGFDYPVDLGASEELPFGKETRLVSTAPV
jgi:hypothetical protein